MVEVNKLFEEFLDKDSLFINKKTLQLTHTPNQIQHRDEQIKNVAQILAPSLRLDKPSNLFLYGKTGTGKTLVTKAVTKSILETANKKNINLKVIYLNCKLKKVADTEYRLIAQIVRDLGKAIPPTGLPTDEVYKIFYQTIDEKEQLLLLILDEIDQLSKKSDEILYNLTRINTELKKAQITIIGISNDLMFVDQLDPRVRSSLSEEEIIFPPYNALQIRDILRDRSNKAFKKNTLMPGVVEKCAAYAAREHGDARRALELLRVAGEYAERNGETKVKLEHIDCAEEKIEKDRVLDITINQPKQHQITLYSILKIFEKKKTFFTGEIYETYTESCRKINIRPLTQRRVSDIIAEFDMLGIINARVISKGRYGRTKEITLGLPKENIENMINILRKAL